MGLTIAKLSGRLERAIAAAGLDLGLFGVLRQEHVEIAVLLDEATREKRDLEKRRALYTHAAALLRAHGDAERLVLYARLMESTGTGGFALEGLHEHDLMEVLMNLLDRTPTSNPEWESSLECLQRTAAQHVREEETEIFEHARYSFNRSQQRQMAEQYRALREAAIRS